MIKIKFLDGTEKEFETLRYANLQEANLQRANLQEVDLQGADLQRANLQRANLQEVDLQGADLRWADLQRADLQRANLQEVDLQGANIRGAGVTVWHLFTHDWILTPTHLHAGCCRWTLEEANALTIADLKKKCSLTETEAQRAHKWMRFALEEIE